MEIVVAIVLAVVVGVGVAGALWVQFRTLKSRLDVLEERIRLLRAAYTKAKNLVSELETEVASLNARNAMLSDLSGRTP